jgi:glycerate-2-kinase
MMPVKERTCLIFGGETVVTVRGRGEGGRNLELALSFALHSSSLPGIAMMTLATDGKDGTSPAAGAVIDSSIFPGRSDLSGAQRALDNNDTYPFLAKRNATLHTGPSGTNVADIACILFQPY